jgi:two-component system, NarL family, invasion response regulator UvrY
MKNPSTIQVALADDHALLRNALAGLINGFENCKVLYQCDNGKQLLQSIAKGDIPHVVLLDLNMPELNGYDTAYELQQQYPQVHMLMLTMYDSELSMIRLLQYGVRGFLKKDIHPSELQYAIRAVMESGYYYSHHTTGKLANLFRARAGGSNTTLQNLTLSEQELSLLKLVCTDLTYKEIAEELKMTPRMIDSMRDQLFVKLDVKSRVGLAMVAIKNGVITL